MSNRYPFELKPLPYEYNALEPHIDEATMKLHHDKHLKAYVDKLNEIVGPYPEFHNWYLETFLCNIHSLPNNLQTPIRNNAGGVYNHNLFFSLLSSKDTNSIPIGNLAEKIEKDLLKLLPKDYLGSVNHLFVWHGRNTCIARKPKCESCTIKNYCKSYNKTKHS